MKDQDHEVVKALLTSFEMGLNTVSEHFDGLTGTQLLVAISIMIDGVAEQMDMPAVEVACKLYEAKVASSSH